MLNIHSRPQNNDKQYLDNTSLPKDHQATGRVIISSALLHIGRIANDKHSPGRPEIRIKSICGDFICGQLRLTPVSNLVVSLLFTFHSPLVATQHRSSIAHALCRVHGRLDGMQESKEDARVVAQSGKRDRCVWKAD